MMAFESLAELVSMGSHGPYVWTAWGATLGFLLLSVILVRGESRGVRRTLRRRLRRDAAVASSPSEDQDEG
ncbi:MULTISPECIES: heme exporter protein CcmD [Halomonas]|jgi:heme exporter protein D|uniref:Heme exporter protein D n=3 Tax=Halomonas TaxID=2745 RepID=A0AAU7KFZ6_9GAMM|nr:MULTISPECIES: heme exporter protein CcmD [Halomonas]MCJ8285533.1 heme exporter protein CcmD [Halomonas sp.]MCO7214525.1 heme exporter protein CcmD [Halomonas sp. OfavH-34-E]USZ49132.1 heme exporter protein CcmD [Halomonas sp. DN3]|tara:strand:- start:1980 stop:2192 length:213 start_codon:yes stop_codon:yes gene_type:complete